MNTRGLNSELKRLLKPLLDEIRSYEKPLNFEDFVEAIENLVSTLTPGEKSVFYRKTKDKPAETVTRSATRAGTDLGMRIPREEKRALGP